MQIQDARDYQILFLGLFLMVGIGTRDWSLRPELILVLILTCLATQVGWEWYQQRCEPSQMLSSQPDATVRWASRLPTERGQDAKQLSVEHCPALNLKSALITALSLSLLLRSDHWITLTIAATTAIASKFLLRVQGKQIFNPANFGIISVLVMTNDAWVSPGQWGNDSWYALLFLGLGGIVLKRVGRWDTSALFLSSYALLEAIRTLWLGWEWDVFSHRLMSGSLLLFALFMVTDPRSIPNARSGRLLWVGCLALLTFVLRNQFLVSTAPFWALFALSPLTVLLDRLWAAPHFTWADASQAEGELGKAESGRQKAY
jgi:Na+-transporting NADH:ubiquinone oxidoreductase subunit NqrB